jgi:hypothetical protein
MWWMDIWNKKSVEKETNGGLTEAFLVVLRFVLTAGLAVLGVIAAVAFAGREAPTSERMAGHADGGAPNKVENEPQMPFIHTGGVPISSAVYLFLVSSDEARADLSLALEAEAMVRTATHEPQRRTWIVIAETPEQVDAVYADAAFPFEDANTVWVVDIRGDETRRPSAAASLRLP